MEACGGHERGLRERRVIIEREAVAFHHSGSSFDGGFGGRSVALAHFNVAVHSAVGMAVQAGSNFQARFGATSGKRGVLACH